jgi:hypothetical protein
MDHPEFKTESFIIRIWFEERAEASGRTLWRGSITHVGSNQRRYFQDLSAIAPFIAAQLGIDGMAAAPQPTLKQRLYAWIQRITQRR